MPAPNSSSGTSGKLGLTWFQLVTLPSDSGAQIVLSSSTVRHLAQSFSLLTISVRASLATAISAYSMPASAQAAASSSLIERDASEMSVSPAQNFLKPPPVPDWPTVTSTPSPSGVALNSSLAAAVSGATVDEPSTRTPPEAAPPLAPSVVDSFWPPHAARNRVGTASAAAIRMRVLPMVVLFVVWGCAGCVLTGRTVGTHSDAQGGRS